MERQSRRNTTAGGVSNNRTFEDYDPAVEWSDAADADTATISLPGFRREEVRVQVDSKGHLLVRGERPVEAGSSKWIRFSKDLMKLPDNYDTGDIRAGKLENSKVTITIPKKNRPSPPGSWYALRPVVPAAQEEEEEGKDRHPSPSGGSAAEPAPAAVQEEKKSCPSPPDDSASEPAPAVQEQEQEKSRPSPPDGSAPEPAPPAAPAAPTQEGKNSLPSPPDGYASAPAVVVQEGTMVETEMAGGRRPIHWLLVAVAALSFVGITAYVVWRKLRSGCSAAGAGSYIDEM